MFPLWPRRFQSENFCFVLTHRVNPTGAKKGTSEVWIENLPGESDHLIRSADKTKETYWMPIVNARNQSKPNLLDYMSDKPYLRKELLDQYLRMGSRVEQLGQEYGNEQLEKLGFQIKTSQQFYQQNIGNNYGLILELDATGNILGSLHSVAGVNSFISEALEGESESPNERVLYIGSFGYPYILKLVIRKPASDLAQSLSASGARAIVSLNDPSPSSQFVSYAPFRAQYAAMSPSSLSSQFLLPLANGSAIPVMSPAWNHLRLSPFHIRHRI